MIKSILPIHPFDYESQNWNCKNAYGRCVVIINNVVFTDDFGPFKKGDKFAEVQIDINGGLVAAWKNNRDDEPVTALVSLIVKIEEDIQQIQNEAKMLIGKGRHKIL